MSRSAVSDVEESADASGRPVRNPLTWLLIGLVRLYRLIPKRSNTCRFLPTCSAYSLESLRRHGALRGSWLTLRRILKCHPWGPTGFDPVPPASDEARATSSTSSPINPSGGYAAGPEEQA